MTPNDELIKFKKGLSRSNAHYFPSAMPSNLKLAKDLFSNKAYVSVHVNFRDDEADLPAELTALLARFNTLDGELRVQPTSDVHSSVVSVLNFDSLEQYKNQPKVREYVDSLSGNMLEREYDFVGDVLLLSDASIALQIFPSQQLKVDLLAFEDELRSRFKAVFGIDARDAGWFEGIVKLYDDRTHGAMNLARYNVETLSQSTAKELINLVQKFNAEVLDRIEPFVTFKKKLCVVQSNHLFSDWSKVLRG